MVEAGSHLKLCPTSILDIYKVFEYIAGAVQHSTAQTRQLDGSNNVGATTVTMPMQSEGKEVSGIMTMMPVQQGG